MLSAICVSHSSRFGLLQRAVINFCEQDCPERELLIVVNEDGYAEQVRGFLRHTSFGKDGPFTPTLIRVCPCRYPAVTDMALWGFALAQGEWLACWDDDNLSHPTRLSWQLQQTQQASVLSEALYYFYDSDELFLADFHQPSGKPAERCAAASLLFHRSALPPPELGTRDSWVCHLLEKLAQRQAYDVLTNSPYLFLVGSNGDNMRDASLHRRIGSQLPATKTRAQLLAMDKQVESELQAYRFPGGKVSVCGKDAAAFEVTGLRDWPTGLAPLGPPEDWHLGMPNRAKHERANAERQEQRAQQQAAQAAKP